MKMKLVAIAVVLAALLVPGASWAVWPSCATCGQLAHGASCTCPGSGPHYIFTTCDKYPLACQPQPLAAEGQRLEKSAFLASLALPPAVSPSTSR
jgi:hypothetical protein